MSAKVFRGRGADDPLNPGQQMCLEPARVTLAMKLHADISSTCCIQRRNGLVCPLFARCGYQRQQMGATPDVWVTAHDMLFHVQKVFGDPKAVIVDERLWPKGIRGIEHEEGDIEWMVPLDSLVKDVPAGGGRGVSGLSPQGARRGAREPDRQWRCRAVAPCRAPDRDAVHGSDPAGMGHDARGRAAPGDVGGRNPQAGASART